MDNFHHKRLKKFSISGVINDESAIQRLRLEYIKLLSTEMRLTGYSPRIDIDPDFTIDYNYDKRIFEFEITMYGIYVGKKKSKWISGIDGQKPIYIQKNKSKGVSSGQASKLNQK